MAKIFGILDNSKNRMSGSKPETGSSPNIQFETGCSVRNRMFGSKTGCSVRNRMFGSKTGFILLIFKF
jgi:hypothetical protein